MRRIVVACGVVAASVLAACADGEIREDFEGGRGMWRLPNKTWSIADGKGRDGSRCLTLSVPTPCALEWPDTKSFKVEPGDAYKIEAWVDASDFTPKSGGVSVGLGFYDEKGNTQYKYFKYSVEGRKLNMTEIKDIKYDDDYTAVTSYETAQLELSYDFTFKGIELKLERANHSIKMSCDYIDSKKDEAPYISVHGFLAKGSPVIDHIAGFSMSRGSEGTYSSIYITFINDKNEDETSSYCHGILKEDGTFTFSIPYATETKTYQYVYFLVEKGIILSDGIVNYKYTEKEDEFKKYKLSAVIGDEDADSISADKQKKLTIVQNSILTDLEKAFADKDIKADIDKATGRVSLDSNILFASDSSDLSSDGKDSLDDFLDVYTSVVLNDSNKDLVANIVVEGHTDTNGDHEYNQKLSEKRAETVADYCTEKVPSLKSIIKSKGYSFDDPVYNDDGTINMEASRRVVFKFVLDTK